MGEFNKRAEGDESVVESSLRTPVGSEQILRTQVDDDGGGDGLGLVVGTVDVQATYGQETRASRVASSANSFILVHVKDFKVN